MIAKYLSAALVLVAASTSSVWAQVQVSDAWARGTVPQQKASGVFLQLQSPSATRLVAARSPSANSVEIHEMTMEDSVMKMRQLPNGLELPAGQRVALKPGGLHIMLMGLKGQLVAGQELPLTLVFQDAAGARTELELKVPVRDMKAAAGGHSGHSDHSGHKH
ncbi:copper chaperone PCu(A)C [Roseateles sp. BYS180W]|uniref:Copper chaperone PCu(A)C n=1 Tax=Roseateles rivi TaxID=3299028 RepID=A0ABW7FYS7_9BURK